MTDTAKKNIALVVVLVTVVGAIWYIESTKAGPHAPAVGSGVGAPQAIGIGAATTSAGTGQGGGNNVTSQTPVKALAALAASDRAAGHAPAVEIADPTGFVNATSGFRLANLVGNKVILLDFWTYSCINCIRTIPYLNAWYQKYAGEGLEIVGIHTPEFDFEKDINNVQQAVAQYGIRYPVILDSDYGTWSAYGNLYWPHEYLIDVAGYVVHDQVGEGNYAGTEAEIQKLLAERDQVLGLPDNVSTGTVDVTQANLGEINSPETYFGSNRNGTLANGTAGMSGVQSFTLPQDFIPDKLYFGGSWNIQPEYASSNASGSAIVFRYDAGKVYFVASAAASTTVQVFQDGKPVSSSTAGSDVVNGVLTVHESRLYNIINNADGGGEHTLKLIVNGPALHAFTFTFG